MDIVNFILEDASEENDLVVNVYVNNKNLKDILKEYENQFDKESAGKYEGIRLLYFDDVIKHFTGNIKESILNFSGKSQLLGCPCGEPGCWPFFANIKIDKNKIIWNGFEQPHRKINSPGGYWDYCNLKAFEFDKNDYESKLLKLSNNILTKK